MHFVRIVETLNEPLLTLMKKYLLWICTAAALLAAGASCSDDPEVDSVGRVGIQQESLTARRSGRGSDPQRDQQRLLAHQFHRSRDRRVGSLGHGQRDQRHGQHRGDAQSRPQPFDQRAQHLCQCNHRIGVLRGFGPAVAERRHDRRRRRIRFPDFPDVRHRRRPRAGQCLYRRGCLLLRRRHDLAPDGFSGRDGVQHQDPHQSHDELVFPAGRRHRGVGDRRCPPARNSGKGRALGRPALLLRQPPRRHPECRACLGLRVERRR